MLLFNTRILDKSVFNRARACLNSPPHPTYWRDHLFVPVAPSKSDCECRLLPGGVAVGDPGQDGELSVV